MFSRLNLAKETPSKKAVKLSPRPKSSPEYFSTEETEAPHSLGPAYSLERLRTLGSGEDRESERQAGRAPMRLPWPMQAKLEVGAVDDPLEGEADRVAEQVLHASRPAAAAPAATPAISRLQRKCSCGGSGSECEACKGEREKEEKPLQRKATGTPSASGVPAIVHDVLRSPGQPLDAATRAFFEPRFGHDFSQVRIHADSQAAESARSVNALAYTVGRDIVFDSGRYAPHTHEGRKLLGHEMAHVVQQGGVESASRQRRIGGEEKAVEKEAAAETASLVTKPVPQTRSEAGGASGLLQRQQRPTPQVLQPWTPDGIAAGLVNLDSLCARIATATGRPGAGTRATVIGLYSQGCPKLCAHRPLPIDLVFFADAQLAPRPGVKKGDKMCALEATVEFVPSSGGLRSVVVQDKGDGTYDAPGMSLDTPSIRRDLRLFTPQGPGTLIVNLKNTLGQGVAVYKDQIKVEDCPGVRGPTVQRSPQQTGRWIEVPDPEKAPLVCYPANYNSKPPFLFEIQIDNNGYFYVYRERKVYFRGEPCR